MANVTVTRVPGRPQVVEVPDNATINDAIVAAGLLNAVEQDGFQPRVGGARVDMSRQIENGMNITLVQQVKGNRFARHG